MAAPTDDELQDLKKEMSKALLYVSYSLSSIMLAIYAVKDGDTEKLVSETDDLATGIKEIEKIRGRLDVKK